VRRLGVLAAAPVTIEADSAAGAIELALAFGDEEESGSGRSDLEAIVPVPFRSGSDAGRRRDACYLGREQQHGDARSTRGRVPLPALCGYDGVDV
jgi:hypothetical protein